MAAQRTDSATLYYLKKFYKVILVVGAAIAFFVVYNVYLVDHSLVNLQSALDQLNNAKTISEAQRLSSLIEFALLDEISAAQLQASSLSKLEVAKELLSKSDSIKELDDVKSALQEIVAQKQKTRAPLFKAMDSLNKVFSSQSRSGEAARLQEQEKYLRQKMEATADIAQRQELMLALGNVYVQMKRMDDADDILEEAYTVAPKSSLGQRALFNLAWNKKNAGKLQEAVRHFEDLAAHSGDSRIASLAKFQAAQTYKEMGQHEKAVVLYQELSSDERSKDLAGIAELQTGNTYLYDIKDYDKAQEAFEKSRRNMQGTEMAQHMESTSMSKIAARYRKDGFELLVKGYETTSPQQYRNALDLFSKALEIDPQDGASYTGRALAYLWLKDPDRAMDAARRAVKLLPGDEIASVNLGYIYLQLGLVEEAIVEYKRYIAVNPFTARTYYNLGYAFVLAGRIEEALAAFQQAGKINPNFAFAFNNEGWCLWQFNQYAKAIEAFERAARLNPTFVDALFNLGMIYKTIGKVEEAKMKFEEVLKLTPSNEIARAQLMETEKLLYK